MEPLGFFPVPRENLYHLLGIKTFASEYCFCCRRIRNTKIKQLRELIKLVSQIRRLGSLRTMKLVGNAIVSSELTQTDRDLPASGKVIPEQLKKPIHFVGIDSSGRNIYTEKQPAIYIGEKIYCD